MPITLKPLESEKFVIAFHNGKKKHKLFQIFFLADNSICVDFPYYKNTSGIAAEISLDPKIIYPTNITLSETWKTTSHLVKYSHHNDWEAHFSQDRKVFTEIRRKACTLKSINGHFFTVTVQWIEHFEEAKKAKDIEEKIDSKRTVLTFKTDKETDCLKFVCELYTVEDFKKTVKPHDPRYTIVGPKAHYKVERWILQIFILSNNVELTDEKKHIIILSCEIIPPLNKNSEGNLVFVGWFDHRDIARNAQKKTSFLALMYPLENINELKEKIWSIDFLSKNNILN